MHLTWRLSIAAAVGSAVAWLVSEPFAYTARTGGTVVGKTQFTLGSFFGWFGAATFGACVVGAMVLVMNWPGMKPARALAWSVAGFVTGGIGGWLADRESDILSIRIFRESTDEALGLLRSEVIWSCFMAVALTLALAASTQPKTRTFRFAVSGVMACILGFGMRFILLPVADNFTVMASGSGKQPGWYAFDPGRLIENAAMAIALALSIGLVETMIQGAVSHREAALGWQQAESRGEATDSGSADQADRPRLVDGWGQVYFLAPGVQEAGRDSGCSIHLTHDLSISRRHARFEVGLDTVTVSDLGSGSGSFVNEEPLTEAIPLKNGDQVRLGNVVLNFRQA